MNALTLSIITFVIVIIGLLGIIVRVNQLDEAVYTENEQYQNLAAKVTGIEIHEPPHGYTEATEALRKQINYDFGKMLDIMEETNKRLVDLERITYVLVEENRNEKNTISEHCEEA